MVLFGTHKLLKSFQYRFLKKSAHFRMLFMLQKCTSWRFWPSFEKKIYFRNFLSHFCQVWRGRSLWSTVLNVLAESPKRTWYNASKTVECHALIEWDAYCFLNLSAKFDCREMTLCSNDNSHWKILSRDSNLRPRIA